MSNTYLSVAVKMYRVGELGDSFLVRFKQGQDQCNLLIDCGSFRNKKESKTRLNLVWEDIEKTLVGKTLDVVVGTHQHNDHLSGFVHGVDAFKKIKADEVWLSWLDDPKDRDARTIKTEQEKAISKVEQLSEKLNDSAFSASPIAEKVSSVLGFNDPVVPAEGLRNLKSIAKKIKYLEPGEIVTLPNMGDEVKVYVLGPPKDTAKLRDIHSSANESYDPHLAAARIQADRMLSAFTNFNPDDDHWEEEHFPFTGHYKIPKTKFPAYTEHCGPVWQSYQEESWRTIDVEWLEEAGNLALYMDKYTNNTSLVLAFHLVRADKFMLFVGDAQTGNWNSWKEIKWINGSKRFSIHDLLNNTILYKVGHHCSHNATSVEGLEAMTDEHLVAMIPVDNSDPNITKEKGWKMPATNLYKRLREKTQNRILRMDSGFIPEGPPTKEQDKKVWTTLPFEHHLTEDTLFMEYQFTLDKQR